MLGETTNNDWQSKAAAAVIAFKRLSYKTLTHIGKIS
jgi:hypothetical protein